MTLTADARDRLASALVADARANRMVQRTWEREGQRCGLGCLARDAVELGLVAEMPYEENEAEVAELLGVPVQVTRLFIKLFDSLPPRTAAMFPARFVSALQPEADYSRLHLEFLLEVQRRNSRYVRDLTDIDPILRERVLSAIEGVCTVLQGETEWAATAAEAARSAAEAVRESAEGSSAYSPAEAAITAAYTAYWSMLAMGANVYTDWRAFERGRWPRIEKQEDAVSEATRWAASVAVWAAEPTVPTSVAARGEWEWMADTLVRLVSSAESRTRSRSRD